MKTLMTLLLTMTSFSLYAQEGAEGMPRDQGLWQTMIMISVSLVFFYFILWRPEQKRRKEKDEQMKQLKKGDRVNAMGIIGTVIRIQDQTVILKMYDGSKIEFIKSAIQEVVPGSEDDVKKAEKEERSLPAAD
jgi:preprotein translocase subunit YajC